MTSADDKLKEPRYSPDDWKQLAECLEILELSDDLADKLRILAQNYFILADIEREPEPEELSWRPLLPGRSKRRNALQKVAKAARALKGALADPAIVLRREEEKLPDIDLEVLDELAAAADKTREQIPGKGSDPKDARITFVRHLAGIYEQVTQRPATRGHDPISGVDDSRFLKFVEAALEPLDPDALTGLDHVVRDVTSSQRRK